MKMKYNAEMLQSFMCRYGHRYNEVHLKCPLSLSGELVPASIIDFKLLVLTSDQIIQAKGAQAPQLRLSGEPEP